MALGCYQTRPRFHLTLRSLLATQSAQNDLPARDRSTAATTLATYSSLLLSLERLSISVIGARAQCARRALPRRNRMTACTMQMRASMCTQNMSSRLRPSKAWTDLERVVWGVLLKICVLGNFSRQRTPDGRMCHRCVVRLSAPWQGRTGYLPKSSKPKSSKRCLSPARVIKLKHLPVHTRATLFGV